MNRIAAVWAVLVFAVAGCVTTPEAVPTPEDTPAVTTDTDTDTDPVPVDCTTACADPNTDPGWALCYACRCKDAMDGWLPSPEELQCGLGEEIVVYTSDDEGTLTPVTTNVSTCANPTLLYGTCSPGGTLGQLVHGTVTVKWICRRNTYERRAGEDPTLPYDDVGAILYNSRNGASCWFDDMDGTGIADDNWPELDLTSPTADPEAWGRYFYNTDGEGCTGCHDNDPFNYTPYLQSVNWVSGDYTSGPFFRVNIQGRLKPISGKHLVSPEAAACTQCHRITSDQTCAVWAPDSVGAYKGGGYQDVVVGAAGDPADPLWHLGTWMPPNTTTDAAGWEASYGTARDTILSCCANPGVDQAATDTTPACVWEGMAE